MDDEGKSGRSADRPEIARIWRGVIREEDAGDYRGSLLADIRDVRAAAGNVGAFVLERSDAGRVEFLFISLWESMEAVVWFAGTDVETPVYFRDDERVLIEMPLRVDHYEVTGAEVAPT